MKKGFTLAEMMVVLLIAGVVAAITIPILKRSIGNTDIPLFKSAYRIVETITSDMISDISLYPSGQFDGTFCTNFAQKVNVVGPVNCTTSDYTTKKPNFVTTNGMAWYGFNGLFTTPTDPQSIQVDINGTKKGDNTLGSDILTVRIYFSGKVDVVGTTETSYLQN